MYQVKEVYAGRPSPLAVEVSFSLSYHDWSQLEASELWHRLEEVLKTFCAERG